MDIDAKKKVKITIVSIAATVLLLLAVVCGSIIIHTRCEAIALDESTSPGGEYTLTLFSVGEPEFPFGRAHGRITLERNGEKLSQTEIDIAADGSQICKENWSVVWQDAYAEVTLRACEQPDEHWRIHLDGRVEQLSNVPIENACN